MKKKCPTCKIEKPIDEFNSQRKYCLVCHKEKGKKWREENRKKWLQSLKISNQKTKKNGYKKRIAKTKKEWKPRAIGNQHRKKAKDFIIAIKKKSKCARCPESDFRCLQFHHLRDKVAGVAEMAKVGYKIETIQKEIEKCIVLCASCHAKEHYSGAGV